jgi:hypothetical protein
MIICTHLQGQWRVVAHDELGVRRHALADGDDQPPVSQRMAAQQQQQQQQQQQMCQSAKHGGWTPANKV